MRFKCKHFYFFILGNSLSFNQTHSWITWKVQSWQAAGMKRANREFGTMTNMIFKGEERQRQILVLSHSEAAASPSPPPMLSHSAWLHPSSCPPFLQALSLSTVLMLKFFFFFFLVTISQISSVLPQLLSSPHFQRSLIKTEISQMGVGELQCRSLFGFHFKQTEKG